MVFLNLLTTCHPPADLLTSLSSSSDGMHNFPYYWLPRPLSVLQRGACPSPASVRVPLSTPPFLFFRLYLIPFSPSSLLPPGLFFLSVYVFPPFLTFGKPARQPFIHQFFHRSPLVRSLAPCYLFARSLTSNTRSLTHSLSLSQVRAVTSV